MLFGQDQDRGKTKIKPGPDGGKSSPPVEAPPERKISLARRDVLLIGIFFIGFVAISFVIGVLVGRHAILAELEKSTGGPVPGPAAPVPAIPAGRNGTTASSDGKPGPAVAGVPGTTGPAGDGAGGTPVQPATPDAAGLPAGNPPPAGQTAVPKAGPDTRAAMPESSRSIPAGKPEQPAGSKPVSPSPPVAATSKPVTPATGTPDRPPATGQVQPAAGTKPLAGPQAGRESTARPAGASGVPSSPAAPPETRPARTAPVPAAPASPREPGPASAGGTYFSIQVFASIHENEAKAIKETLSGKGYQSRLNGPAGDKFWRVLVGRYPDLKSAQPDLDRLKSDGFGGAFPKKMRE